MPKEEKHCDCSSFKFAFMDCGTEKDSFIAQFILAFFQILSDVDCCSECKKEHIDKFLELEEEQLEDQLRQAYYEVHKFQETLSWVQDFSKGIDTLHNNGCFSRIAGEVHPESEEKSEGNNTELEKKRKKKS